MHLSELRSLVERFSRFRAGPELIREVLAEDAAKNPMLAAVMKGTTTYSSSVAAVVRENQSLKFPFFGGNRPCTTPQYAADFALAEGLAGHDLDIDREYTNMRTRTLRSVITFNWALVVLPLFPAMLGVLFWLVPEPNPSSRIPIVIPLFFSIAMAFISSLALIDECASMRDRKRVARELEADARELDELVLRYK